MDIVKVSVYVNLITLSAAIAILPDTYKEVVTNVLVGIVFATAVGIVLYQIHITYIAKSVLWRKMKSNIQIHCACFQQEVNTHASMQDDALIHNATKLPNVSRSFISLRESLLTDDS